MRCDRPPTERLAPRATSSRGPGMVFPHAGMHHRRAGREPIYCLLAFLLLLAARHARGEDGNEINVEEVGDNAGAQACRARGSGEIAGEMVETEAECEEACLHPPALPPLALPAVPRLVAIGDLHGDLDKTKRSFRLAGATDEQDRWVGGNLVVVQVGDQLDRGDHEVAILYYLERLQREAARAGGALHILNGNHETMNVAGRFRYATPEGIADFFRQEVLQRIGDGLKRKCGCVGEGAGSDHALLDAGGNAVHHSGMKARLAALAPGGPVTRRFLAPHPIVLQVGSTVFVHGGILPEHVDYGLERINTETRDWMEGRLPKMPGFLGGRSAIVWAREYSAEDRRRCDCAALQRALAGIPGAQRMVVGHTIQEQGINSACEEQVYRIDVGMSRGCGNGEPEVLEILEDNTVRRLQEDSSAYPGAGVSEQNTQSGSTNPQGWSRFWPPWGDRQLDPPPAT